MGGTTSLSVSNAAAGQSPGRSGEEGVAERFGPVGVISCKCWDASEGMVRGTICSHELGHTSHTLQGAMLGCDLSS